jgi:hypothetical protein
MNEQRKLEDAALPCPSDFTLERLRQGELEKASPAGGHLGGCPSCQARLRAMDAPPLSLDLAAVWRAAGSARPRPWSALRWLRSWWALGGAAVSAAAVLLVVSQVRPPDIQRKGSPFTLALVARTPDGSVRRIDPGAPLRAGDRLRFEVSTTWSEAQVALISVDARGAVSALVPAGGATVTVSGGQRRLLDGAVELDEAMGPERILLVGCPRPLAVTTVTSAASAALARAGGDLRRLSGLGLGCHEETFWINKVPR